MTHANFCAIFFVFCQSVLPPLLTCNSIRLLSTEDVDLAVMEEFLDKKIPNRLKKVRFFAFFY